MRDAHAPIKQSAQRRNLVFEVEIGTDVSARERGANLVDRAREKDDAVDLRTARARRVLGEI